MTTISTYSDMMENHTELSNPSTIPSSTTLPMISDTIASVMAYAIAKPVHHLEESHTRSNPSLHISESLTGLSNHTMDNADSKQPYNISATSTEIDNPHQPSMDGMPHHLTQWSQPPRVQPQSLGQMHTNNQQPASLNLNSKNLSRASTMNLNTGVSSSDTHIKLLHPQLNSASSSLYRDGSMLRQQQQSKGSFAQLAAESAKRLQQKKSKSSVISSASAVQHLRSPSPALSWASSHSHTSSKFDPTSSQNQSPYITPAVTHLDVPFSTDNSGWYDPSTSTHPSQPHIGSVLPNTTTATSNSTDAPNAMNTAISQASLHQTRIKSNARQSLPINVIPPRKDSADLDSANPLNQAAPLLTSDNIMHQQSSKPDDFTDIPAEVGTARSLQRYGSSTMWSSTTGRKPVRSPFSKEHNNVIFSGFLWKCNRFGKFQQRICRFDGGIFVSLSSNLSSTTPKGVPVHEYDPIDSPAETVNTNFSNALRTGYPYGCPVPALTMGLIAGPVGRFNPSPDIQARAYSAPKWVIAVQDMHQIRQWDPLSRNTKSAESRTFTIVTTSHDEYTFRAKTLSECRQWVFLLSKIIISEQSKPTLFPKLESSVISVTTSVRESEDEISDSSEPLIGASNGNIHNTTNTAFDARHWSSTAATQYQFAMMRVYASRLESWKKMLYAIAIQESSAIKHITSIQCSPVNGIQAFQGTITDMPELPKLSKQSKETLQTELLPTSSRSQNDMAVTTDSFPSVVRFDMTPVEISTKPSSILEPSNADQYIFSDEDDDDVDDAGFGNTSQLHSDHRRSFSNINTNNLNHPPVPTVPAHLRSIEPIPVAISAATLVSPAASTQLPTDELNSFASTKADTKYTTSSDSESSLRINTTAQMLVNSSTPASILLSADQLVSESTCTDTISDTSGDHRMSIASSTPFGSAPLSAQRHSHLAALENKPDLPTDRQLVADSISSQSTNHVVDHTKKASSDLLQSEIHQEEYPILEKYADNGEDGDSDGVVIIETLEYDCTISSDGTRMEDAFTDEESRSSAFFSKQSDAALAEHAFSNETGNITSIDSETALVVYEGAVSTTTPIRFRPRSTSLRRAYRHLLKKKLSNEHVDHIPLAENSTDSTIPNAQENAAVIPSSTMAENSTFQYAALEMELYTIGRIPPAEAVLDPSSVDILKNIKVSRTNQKHSHINLAESISPSVIAPPRTSSMKRNISSKALSSVPTDVPLLDRQVQPSTSVLASSQIKTDASRQQQEYRSRSPPKVEPSLDGVNHACKATIRLLDSLAVGATSIEPFFIREFAAIAIPHHHLMLRSFAFTHLNEEVPVFCLRYPKHAPEITHRAELLNRALAEFDGIMHAWNTCVVIPLIKDQGIDDAIDPEVALTLRGEGKTDAVLVTALRYVIRDIHAYFNT
ncbi:hypothetical protein QVD99_003955 [Batrachochytrium dendrobatidis]|nr:hypothetical protein QVD99_003955 [Batrachochytrium dendrobatidis]